MHEFTDAEGRRWAVSVGRESYGIVVLLFAPMQGEGVRKAMLGVDTRLEAERELAAMSEEQLLEHLEASIPWESRDWMAR